ETQPRHLASTDSPDVEAAGIVSGRPVVSEWWTTLRDAALESLVTRLVDENLDLKVAMTRVREARALRTVSASSLYPQLALNGRFGDAQLGAERWHSGANYSIGFDANWEIDVFGGLRRGVEAADANVQAALEGRRDTLVTLLGELGRNYVELRGEQRQLEIARRNVALQEKTLDLIKIRRRAGLASDLEIAQVTRLLETTRANVPALEQLIARSIFRLSVLVGREPAALLGELGKPAPLPATPPSVPVGLGSELLLRRPDIRRAERSMAAACAQTGVARADLYPRFSLTGTINYGSSGGLPGAPGFYAGPAITWPIFAGFRIVANIDAADARLERAVLGYRSTVLVALEDVENAITAYGKELVRRDVLARAATEAEKASRFAQVQYNNGLVDFLNVIDAQSTLATAQQALVLSEQTLLVNLIAVYKALGGGWDVLDVKLSEREVQPSDTELPR
ncbi:MAG: efflux transporter outer membrane subunit, partial [Planctomycetota bacterium]